MNGLTTEAGAIRLLKEAKMRPTATTVDYFQRIVCGGISQIKWRMIFAIDPMAN